MTGGNVGEAITDIKHNNVPALINTSIELSNVIINTLNIIEIANIAEITPVHVLANIALADKIFFHIGEADAQPTEIPGLYWELKSIFNTGNKKEQTFICQSNTLVV